MYLRMRAHVMSLGMLDINKKILKNVVDANHNTNNNLQVVIDVLLMSVVFFL